MDAHELSRRISHWTKAYGFCGHVVVRRSDFHYFVEFETKTTKTRASSIVTRLRLLVHEIAEGADVAVSKSLLSAPAATRGGISRWLIYASIPIKKKNLPREISGPMSLTLGERNELI